MERLEQPKGRMCNLEISIREKAWTTPKAEDETERWQCFQSPGVSGIPTLQKAADAVGTGRCPTRDAIAGTTEGHWQPLSEAF